MYIVKSIISVSFILALISLPACKKADDLNKPLLGLEGDTWAKTPLDSWLDANFTEPYNMNVKYRWDASELGANNTLVPPDTARVRDLMQTIKQAWIDIYVEEVNEAFVKELCPRQYHLVGSLRYNGSTVTLGEAEGGSTVRIFDVNSFHSDNDEKVKRVLKTIHHEFTHILNQNVNFPYVEFQAITKAGYIGTWNQTSLAEAREEGFISNYAKAAPGEDFAEMVSIMVTEGRLGYAAILNGISSESARAAIKQKEDIVVTYLKQVWDIDLYSLMDRCQLALWAINPPPPLAANLGSDKAYLSVKVDTLAITGLSASFLQAYKDASTNLGTLGNAGRYIEFFWLYFDSADQLRLRIQYRNPSNPSSYYQADFAYKMSLSPDGEMTLAYEGPPAESVTANNNARTIASYVEALTVGYMENTFKIQWPGGLPPLAPPFLGGFYKANNPDDFFLGELGN